MKYARFSILIIALLVPSFTRAQDINQELAEAAKRGDTAAVETLLAAGADVNAKTEDGWTALMTAADMGHITRVQALL